MELTPEETAAVRFIAHGFRGGAPIRVVLDNAEATYGCLAWNTSAAQRHLLAETVDYTPVLPHTQPRVFSFGARRISRFVRLLLDQVERSGAGIIPEGRLIELAASYALKKSYMNNNNSVGEQEYVHIVVNGPDGYDIVLRTSCALGTAANDVGLRLWEGGVVSYLAILKNPVLRGDIVGKNVLELGSGLGLTAHALVAMGASSLVLSDISSPVLEVLRANVRHIDATFKRSPTREDDDGDDTNNENSAPHAPEMRVTRVDVRDHGMVSRVCATHSISTILCADLTYDPLLAVAVSRAIEAVICAADSEGNKIVAYLFATKRTETTDRTLKNALERTALNIEEIPLSIDARGLQSSSFATLLACNKTWDFTKVKLYRLT